MTTGYAGKILSINLTNRTVTALETEKYEEFGGGNGMGAALFWELCQDKTVSGLDPKNVVTVMTSPLSGTPTPSASRMELCGISPFAYPVEWFSRSSIGGFFGAMLKYAGWDGIVIRGRADKPVWVNILNDKVTIEDAGSLWGLDVVDAQREIWRRVTGRDSFGEWLALGDTWTTQGPSILSIGPGGESLSRMGTIHHGNGMCFGLGGFGGVWGAKNLKAISVLGTGGIRVADPNALLVARAQIKAIVDREPRHMFLSREKESGRDTSCPGCFQKCKSRVQSGVNSDAKCLGIIYGNDISSSGKSGSDIINRCGLMINDVAPFYFTAGSYINKLYKAGVLGPGKAIDSAPLPMDKFGQIEYTEAICQAIVNREGIGADLAEGLMRAARKWGRLEQDLASGLLDKSQWGYGWHWSLPFMEQAYGSLMGDRDISERVFQHPVWGYLKGLGQGKITPEKVVEILSQKFIPYTDDPLMFDYTWQEADGSKMKHALETGIYSEHNAKVVAWHRHYTRFWEESMLYCDSFWPNFIKYSAPGFSGFTPEFEPRFYNAVTGQSLTFADSMEIGRKIWNLNRAIWVLQGRHRDMEKFAEFMYTPAGGLINHIQNLEMDSSPMTVYENGKWQMVTREYLYLDKAGVEQWKTNFYKLEGWDPDTGWPTRNTLEELGLKNAADTLESAGRLGSPG
jgi:aldehyde:ferredoxin oxidoreductase